MTHSDSTESITLAWTMGYRDGYNGLHLNEGYDSWPYEIRRDYRDAYSEGRHHRRLDRIIAIGKPQI